MSRFLKYQNIIFWLFWALPKASYFLPFAHFKQLNGTAHPTAYHLSIFFFIFSLSKDFFFFLSKLWPKISIFSLRFFVFFQGYCQHKAWPNSYLHSFFKIFCLSKILPAQAKKMFDRKSTLFFKIFFCLFPKHNQHKPSELAEYVHLSFNIVFGFFQKYY